MNLAQKYRPKTIDEIAGQEDLVGVNGVIREFLERKNIPHMFFWGTPGSGKTSLARVIAGTLELDFFEKNATSIKVEELRSIFNAYKNTLTKPLIFIDEVHRLSKTQQEVLLPVMEANGAIIIGASTENPFFALTDAVRSRGFLFEFKPLSHADLRRFLERVAKQEGLKIAPEAVEFITSSSGGDVRAMLNTLEFSARGGAVDLQTAQRLRQSAQNTGASGGDTHYNLTSALIKSMRGSDENAAIYYLARLLSGGEDPRFIARRLVIFASEDIGNANPNALNLATSCFSATATIGMPEVRIILAQTVIYLSLSPKSNAAYAAIDKALDLINKGELQAIPSHLKDAHYSGAKELGVGGYLYPHDFGGWVKQRYLEKPLDLVSLKGAGFEQTLLQWKEKILLGTEK